MVSQEQEWSYSLVVSGMKTYGTLEDVEKSRQAVERAIKTALHEPEEGGSVSVGIEVRHPETRS